GPAVTVPVPAGAGATPMGVTAGGAPPGDLSGRPPPAPESVGVPTGVDIDGIDVHAGVESLGLNPDGTSQVPARFDMVGWYADGPRPGDPGPAVLEGHVDSTSGPAVFVKLRTLRPGALVRVRSATG